MELRNFGIILSCKFRWRKHILRSETDLNLVIYLLKESFKSLDIPNIIITFVILKWCN
ncbi:hypothetical protein BN938_2567 [Mucinivorans hirudinis]|uniref:Uncharacterized protein n=1 Tax=Mucinivorans hirudinis TaxID=1433126 RepID=A0A060RAL0_9BACT|nr:hypothetical protein BN938_2567 [Mucinivorans hirudinis]